MERIGERLRRKREELGLTLEDVSESIRYRPEIISAIEEGRTSVFPAKAYLSAFLRAYAEILGLDPREIVREQKSEEERAYEAIRSIRMKPKRRRRIPRKALYVAIPVALAVILLIVVDRFLWERAPEVTETPAEVPVTAVPAGPPAAADTATQETGDGAGGEAGEEGTEGSVAGETPAPTQDVPEESARERGADSEEQGPAESRQDESPGGGAGGSDVSIENAFVPPADDDRVLYADRGAPETDQALDGESDAPSDEPETAEIADGEGAPAAAPEEAETDPEVETERRPHKLVVSARRGAYVSISTGGRVIHDGYFSGGEVDSFYSMTPFVIVALTDRGAWSFVQDGRRVRLPGSSSEDVSDFEIPVPSGD